MSDIQKQSSDLSGESDLSESSAIEEFTSEESRSDNDTFGSDSSSSRVTDTVDRRITSPTERRQDDRDNQSKIDPNSLPSTTMHRRRAKAIGRKKHKSDKHQIVDISEGGNGNDLDCDSSNERNADPVAQSNVRDLGWRREIDEQAWRGRQRQQGGKSELNPMLRSRIHLVKRCKLKQQSTVDDRHSRSSSPPSLSSGSSSWIVEHGGDSHAALGSSTYALNEGSYGGDRNCLHAWLDGIDKSNQFGFDEKDSDSSELFTSSVENNSLITRSFDATKEHRCSEFSSPLFGLSNLFKNLFQLTASDSRNTNNSNSYEWQHQAESVKVKEAKSGKRKRQDEEDDNMPNQNVSYGTNRGHQYQPVGQEQRQLVLRRNRDLKGYSRLGKSHYQNSDQPTSIIQEFKRFLLLLVIVAVCGIILWQIYEVLVDDETNYLGVVRQSPSQLGEFYNYAVSTDAKPCARVGKELLDKGGHAVDAAIGTLICMGVVLPNSLGLGGGCLMTIYDNVTKQGWAIDGREQAPDYAHENMFDTATPLMASRGPLSVGVPGELAAYWEAHKRFGRLKWSELFNESIRMAEHGEPVVAHLSHALRDPRHAVHITPLLRAIMWNNATSDYVAENDILRQPALAETLKRIRDNGASEFYNGPTGAKFIDDLQKQGGNMTLKNLSQYKALVKNATRIEISNEIDMYTQPVPGSGPVLGIIVRIMRELGYWNNEKPKYSLEAAGLYYHHLVEAFKFAYAQRGALEDLPDEPARMAKLLALIDSDEFIREAAGKIRDDKTLASKEYGGLQYFRDDHGTAHVSVMDAQGNSVGVTTSVNLYFGSGLVSPSTGIIYNDVMDDFVSPNLTNKFNLAPSKFNRIRPGRRPLSSMAPSVFVDGKGNPRLVLGASGGSMITTAIASVSLRNVFMNEDIKTAIDGPRIHHQFLPEEVRYEANFPSELLAKLDERDHELKKITGRSSVVMAIACEYRNNGTEKYITANSDYRKGGSVAGV